MHKDLQTFQQKAPWLLKKDAIDEYDICQRLFLDADFKKKFPKMAFLVNKARIINIKARDARQYQLFSWDSKAGPLCGWLLQKENNADFNIKLSDSHELLLQNIAGIKGTYNSTDNMFSNNHNFIFLKSECKHGIGSVWNDFYKIRCTQTASKPIIHDNLLVFASEHGNQYTMYHPDNESIIVFMTDPGYTYLKQIDGQPYATFFTINGVHTFTDYVETLAQQWLDWVV
jgi:hypothetical protein